MAKCRGVPPRESRSFTLSNSTLRVAGLWPLISGALCLAADHRGVLSSVLSGSRCRPDLSGLDFSPAVGFFAPRMTPPAAYSYHLNSGWSPLCHWLRSRLSSTYIFRCGSIAPSHYSWGVQSADRPRACGVACHILHSTLPLAAADHLVIVSLLPLDNQTLIHSHEPTQGQLVAQQGLS